MAFLKCLLMIAAAALIVGCSGMTPSTDNPGGSQATEEKAGHIRIGLASVFVNDQDKALRFYTEILGFVKKTDIPFGEHSFLTVASPDGPEGIELLLEPNAHPAAKAYQEAIYADGIPATALFVNDIQGEYERLLALGVEFKTPPAKMGDTTQAVFDDTCGNYIQLNQP